MDEITAITYEALWDDVASLYDAPMRTAQHKKRVFRVLKLCHEAGMATTADLTPVLVSKVVANRPADEAPTTTFTLLSTMATLCRYYEGQGYHRASPFRFRPLGKWIRVPKPAPGPHQTKDEIRRVLDLMARDEAERQGWAQWRSRRLLTLTWTVAVLGLRRNEALYAHVADVDLERRVFSVTARTGNPGKTVHSVAPVPIAEALVPILRDWLAHRDDRPSGWPLPQSNPWLFPTCGQRGRAAPWTSGSIGQRPIARLQRQLRSAPGLRGLRGRACAVLSPVTLKHTVLAKLSSRDASGTRSRAPLGGFTKTPTCQI
jgi:integrase